MMAPLTVGLGPLRLHPTRGGSAEQALEITELRYRRLFETAQAGILILNGETGKNVHANKAVFAKLQTEEYIRHENHPLRTKGGKIVAVEFVSNVCFVGAEKVIQCNIRN